MAFTGIAASLLPGGTTLHSRFRLPVPVTNTSNSRLSADSREANEIRNAGLILWDEASMCSLHILHAVDRFLRDICQVNTIFGGKVVVIGGDFRQTLPIAQRTMRNDGVTISLKRSALWPQLVKYALVQNMRANADQVAFAEWLRNLGSGVRDQRQLMEDQLIRLPDEVLFNHQQNGQQPYNETVALHQCIDFVYEEDELTVDILRTRNRAILTPLNLDVERINTLILDRKLRHGNRFEFFISISF